MKPKRFLAILLFVMLLMGVLVPLGMTSAQAEDLFIKITATTTDVPEGLWAFVARGYSGGNGTGPSGSGGAPGQIMGIYYGGGAGGFEIGTIAGGARVGNGGAGGAGRYIFDRSARTGNTVGNIIGIVAVAGGGGGVGSDSASNRGGNAGASNVVPMQGYQNGGGVWAAQSGGGGTIATSRNVRSGGGGGSSSGGQGGTYSTPAMSGNGADGGWFSAGAGGTAAGPYNTGGGGGGLYGGGGGGCASTSGGGGGGSSFSNAVNAVPGPFVSPFTYFEYAVNYFWSEAGITNSQQALADGSALLVYLGPTPTAVCATFIDYDGANQETRTVFCEAGTTISPPAQNTYTGWTPVGWARDDTAADAAPTSDFTITQNTTFYGLYAKTLTLDYEADGGSPQPPPQTGDRRVNSSNIAVIVNPTLTLAPAIGKSGFTFDGWANVVKGSKHGAETDITISADTTMLAVWKVAKHTVTYNYAANGGTSATKASDSVTEGFPIDLTPQATKPGWEFAGWNTNQNAGSGLPSLTMGNADVTLFAIFKPILVTDVSFRLKGWYGPYPDAFDYIWLKAKIEPDNATDQAVAWNSSNPAVANIYAPLVPGLYDDDGTRDFVNVKLLKTLSVGQATITATSNDGPQAIGIITVTQNQTDIELNPEDLGLLQSSSVQLEMPVLTEGAGGEDVVWTSSNPAVATVDGTGVVKTKSAGTAVITGRVAFSKRGGIRKQYTVTVNSENSNPVKFKESVYTLNYRGSLQLSFDGVNAAGYTWHSNNSAVQVGNGGQVASLKSFGFGKSTSATITVKEGNNTVATCQVKVAPAWWQWLITVVLFGWIWY